MGLYDETIDDIRQNALEQWDYSGIFPATGYTNPKGPICTNAYPWQLHEQLQAQMTNGGQLTQPYVSIYTLQSQDNETNRSRTFGDIYQVGGGGPANLVMGRRAKVFFVVTCWADEQLGGMDFVRKLAGQVAGAIIYHRNRLQTIHHLNIIHTHEAELDSAGLWSMEQTIEGDALVTINV